MISVNKAISFVNKHTFPLEIVSISLADSLNHILAIDIKSPINMPPFRQSAMDGYALNMNAKGKYKIIGEIKAGDPYNPELKSGEAVRIYTGAAVPDSANTVVIQERVKTHGDVLELNDIASLGDNIRPLGEHVTQNQVALKKGTYLTAAGIGFLTTLGITTVSVYKKPSIAIICTGSELVKAGNPLSHGRIYESNTIMLETALNSLGFICSKSYDVKDNYNDTYNVLDLAINSYDLVLITGGISVGDYDFVGKALNNLGVNQLFYKVNQKPGKPLFYGQKGGTTVFALPGNPAAALSCCYIYVQTALQLLSGNESYKPTFIKKKSTSEFLKKGDRAQFLKAIIVDDSVSILEGQSSAMLQTFALANALVFLPEDNSEIKVGDFLDVMQLPI